MKLKEIAFKSKNNLLIKHFQKKIQYNYFLLAKYLKS